MIKIITKVKIIIIIITDHSPGRASQSQFIQILNKHCKHKNPNWPEANQLTLYKAQPKG